MLRKRRDIAQIIAPPPLLFLFFLGVAWLIDYLYPVHFEFFPFTARLVLSIVFSVPAMVLAALAFYAMRKAKTPVEPCKPTERVVQVGSFRLTRNPLYLALLTMFLAIALLVNSLWFYIAVPCLFMTLHYGVVLREEQYLKTKFGNEYTEYSQKVRRWL
jgi:protein-S-isoprenylcysteine O-methyltransferase Ste14